jgi:hypothetical protein
MVYLNTMQVFLRFFSRFSAKIQKCVSTALFRHTAPLFLLQNRWAESLLWFKWGKPVTGRQQKLSFRRVFLMKSLKEGKASVLFC